MATSSWFNSAAKCLTRELRHLVRTPGEVVFCLLMPIVWMLFVWGLLGRGIITEVPLAFVDNDRTEITRSIGRAVDANRSVSFVSFNNHAEAMNELRAGRVYGVFEVPFGYTRDKLSLKGSSLILYLDETRYAIAGTLQAEITAVVSSLTQESTEKLALSSGIGYTGANRLIKIIHPDFNPMGNLATNFNAFLGSNLMPGVLMLGAILCFITVIVREDYGQSITDWISTADGRFSAALTGKLLPYLAYYSLALLWYIALFAGQGGWTAAGSLLIWYAVGVLCLIALLCTAILFCAITPTWRFAFVLTSGYAAPALPFTGFSIPLDSMGPYVQLFSKIIPLTWFIEGQTQQWILATPLYEMKTTFTALILLAVIPLILGVPLLKFVYGKRAEKQQKEALEQDSIHKSSGGSNHE